MNLSKCVFIITGGCSGLGAATSQMAWEAGARVLLADRCAPPSNHPLHQLDPHQERWCWQDTDVSDDTQGSAAVYMAQDRFGRVDVLVNAAGVAFAECLHGREGPHQLSTFQKVMEVNLLGSFNMMRLAVSVMMASPPRPGDTAGACRGVIINTASVEAFDGQMGQVALAASKGGVAAMTLPAARDLAHDRIRVMAIAPGAFNTPLTAGLPPETRVALAASVPCPARLGQATEYAALVRHIVENEYLNGEVIRLDGGLRLAAC